jgi:hypothetical protein
MNIQERLAIFFRRLEAAPPAKSAKEAVALVCKLIEEVEDEFCPLPRENPPPQLRFTGRMYAPQPDRIFPLANGVLMAATRRHLIFCHANGAIQIEEIYSGEIVFVKAPKNK